MSQSEVQSVALVTGASGGLGKEVARQLAEQGVHVVIASRDPAAAAKTAEELGVSALTVRLDLLINNAAAYVDWSEMGSTADIDASKAVMETNLYGGWRMTQALLPLLQRSSAPRIVNVSSGAGSHEDASTWPGAENMGARPVEVSATGVVWAATLPDDGPTGGFFRDRKPLPW